MNYRGNPDGKDRRNSHGDRGGNKKSREQRNGQASSQILIVPVPQAVKDVAEEEGLAPGHRFKLYARWVTPKWLPPVKGAKVLKGLKEVVKFHREIKDGLIEPLIARQKLLARGPDVLHISATAQAPFTAGLGEAHPFENSFAFLDPYGIPYYPGSSIKGVVRRAAEEIALFGDSEGNHHGWTIPLVWCLFGFEEGSAYLGKAQNWRN